MRININVTGWLKKFTNMNESIFIEVPQNISVEEVLKTTSIPMDEIGIITLITDKETLISENYIPTDNDTIKIYSVFIGG